MVKNTLEKPENMAKSETFKIMPLVEPPLECGQIYIDGVPIEEAIKAINDSKRQPIKEQTLDEFNNARQVAYGSNVQVEPMTESVDVKNGYNFDDVSVSNIDTDKMKNLIK